jgi:nucleotide-binding universal stress UspA family protein
MSTVNVPPVVVGVDGSHSSKRALRWAIDYAVPREIPVVAVIVWDLPATYGMPVQLDDVDLEGRARTVLDQAIEEVVGDRPAVERRVERGHAADVLVAVSAQAGLLVLGVTGHRDVTQRLLGSVTLHCVQHARCPVLVDRGE